nr:hypothetical protein [Tanacetum cinerariifolium]
KPKREDTHVPQSSGPTESITDEAVHKELGDRLVRAATTASSLEAELWFENVSKHSNDSLLTRGNTLRSDEDRLKLKELMALCTNLQNKVLDLDKTKTTQFNELASLKRRVKKLKKRNMSRTHKLKRLYKVGLTERVESSDDEESLGEDASKQEKRIDAIDADKDITLVSVQYDAEMFDVNADLGSEEVFVEHEVVGQNENVVKKVIDEVTLAQALEELRNTKPKAKGLVIQEPGESTTTTRISSKQSHDKGKAIMIEEPVKPKKKEQIRLDEKDALRLQAQEQEELSIEEKSTLFQQLLEKRRKYFVAKRAEEKRNNPPTQAQQRKIMCTYQKNMERYTLK